MHYKQYVKVAGWRDKENNSHRKHDFSGRGIVFCILFFLVTILCMPLNMARAEDEYGPGQDHFKFELGGYFPSVDTSLKISGQNIGTDIDIEDILGFSASDSLFRLDGYWRFFKRHRLGFGYYQFNRKGIATLNESIEIGDVTFPAKATVSSKLDLGFYTIDYIYSFVQGEQWEISGLVGAYWVDFKFAADGSTNFGGRFYRSTDFNGPLPFLGLNFEYYITPKWLAIVKGSYFQLDINDIDGSLTNLGTKLEYQFTKIFGLGVGYDYFRIDVTAKDNDLSSKIYYQYQGVQAYGIMRF